MQSAREYFGNIKDTVTSFWHGMSITLSYMVRRPITIQYPDRVEQPVREALPSRYRGLLEVDMAICTACMNCEKACPVGCIKIETEKDPADPKKRSFTQFDIDEARCMFCGLCVEPCTYGAIQHTREFEAARSAIDNLVLRWVPDPLKPLPVFRPTKGVEPVRAPIGSLLHKVLEEQRWNAASPVAPVAQAAREPAVATPAPGDPAPGAPVLAPTGGGSKS